MNWFLTELRTNPSPANCARAGMVLVGTVGMIGGLVIGLHVHAATAWAAMFEVGIPAALVGGVAGLLAGYVLALRRVCRQ